MLIEELLQSELPDDGPIESTDAVLASVWARVRTRQRTRRYLAVAVAAVIIAIVPVLAVRLSRSDPSSVGTIGATLSTVTGNVMLSQAPSSSVTVMVAS